MPDLPYNPQRWNPPCAILGEAFKSAATRASAHAAARAHLPAARSAHHRMYAEAFARAAPGAQLSVPPPSLPVPEAESADEAVSRHEGPVRAVRWHPVLAVLASASQAVAVWMPSAAPLQAAVAAPPPQKAAPALGGSVTAGYASFR